MNKYVLKVYPAGMGREVYRVLEIDGSRSLDDLCMLILRSFDFLHEHLYEFCMDNRMYSHASYEYDPEHPKRSQTRRTLDQLGLRKGQKFSLHYDYGDDWMFTIGVQRIEETQEKTESKVVKSKGSVEQYPSWDEDEEE